MDLTKIYDVAGSAGVSLATVSRVLNHPEKVKPATREKVLRIIKEKGYKPNANARGLASRKSTTVAIVVPTLTRASISEMIQGVVDSAKKFGYMIRLFVNDDPENEKDVWGNVIASSVDGILLMNDEMSSQVFELIQYTPVPVIFVNGVSRRKAFGSVCIDNEKCSYDITKQMIEKGNKKITFISTIHPYLVNELKVKGYVKAMEEAGLEPEIIKTTGVLEQNEQDFSDYLSNKKPEVVLAVRDSMAISFMNIAKKQGIKIPEELQVVGFQNTRYAQLSDPKLSCVDTPIYEIGNVAMSELTQLMNDEEEVKPRNIFVDYKIVWRDSTK
jgi:LacI family transcriptional regulator